MQLFTTESYKCTFAPGQGSLGRVAASRNSEFIPDVSALDAEQFGRLALAAKYGIKSIYIVPCGSGCMEVGSATGWDQAPTVTVGEQVVSACICVVQ